MNAQLKATVLAALAVDFDALVRDVVLHGVRANRTRATAAWAADFAAEHNISTALVPWIAGEADFAVISVAEFVA